jgi:hypothetical protein
LVKLFVRHWHLAWVFGEDLCHTVPLPQFFGKLLRVR